MTLKKITPVVVVDAIEPCLGFWVDRLGFTRTVEVPHGDALGFVILNHGSTELMLQSRASVEADVPALIVGGTAKDGVGLFIEVDGPLDPWVEKLKGMIRTIPEEGEQWLVNLRCVVPLQRRQRLAHRPERVPYVQKLAFQQTDLAHGVVARRRVDPLFQPFDQIAVAFQDRKIRVHDGVDQGIKQITA